MRINLLFSLLLAVALPVQVLAQQSAKPPQLPLPRATAAKKPASAASAPGATDPADLPKPDAATCTGPACHPTLSVPELKAVGREKQTPKLTSSANKAVSEAQGFANNSSVAPTLGKGGRVLFTYGDSIPTVVCAPLRVCDVELEAGETIQGAPHIGDAVRWRISPAVSYEGDQRVTHLIVKATAADLDTNLIVPTDRRTYYLRLVSSEDKYVSRVAFDNPENDTRAWRRLQQQGKPAGETGASPAAATATDDLPAVNLSRLRFDYAIKTTGYPKFKPLRVMDDGAHVFITLSDSVSVDEAPVLFVVGPDGTEQIINYRLRGNVFVIDRLADRLALVSGTGKTQQRVDISLGGDTTCVKKGWFGRCGPAQTQIGGE